MELELRDGDYIPDGAGGAVRASGADALLARVRFRLCARRGAFPFAPELGSRLHLLTREKPSARAGAARQYVAEALADEPGLRVEDVSLTETDDALRLHVTLLDEGETYSLTLETGGN